MPRRKPQPSSKKPERRSPRKHLTKSTVAMPDSIDPLPSQPPQEASASASATATKPDPEMPPRRSHGGGKLRKPITEKLRAAAEERLAQLRVKLRLHPLDPPRPSLSAASSPHEAALRSLGLLDFARLDLQSEPPRPDLVAQFIAYYDPVQHRSFVWDNRLAVSRTDFARALSLPPKPASTASPPDVDSAALVSAVMQFMRVYVLAPFTDCILPPEVAAAEQAVKDGSAHRVDWTGLIWGLVEKEILELPKRDNGVCYYGPYLQRLILTQKPDLFELLEEEEKGEVALVVSLDEDMDQDDGDASKSSDEMEPRDANADVRNNLVEESEIEDTPLRSNNLDELESEDADADTRSDKVLEVSNVEGAPLRSKGILEESNIEGAPLRSNNLGELELEDADADTRSKKILEEPIIEGACFGSNNLDELESGNADADTRRKNIMEESEIEGARLNSNNLDELELGDADADMSSKKILEESKIEGAPLRSNNLDELESGNADADTRRKNILEESEIEGARLNINNLDELELGDADADMSSKKILEESKIEGAPLRSNNLDELESGNADANTRRKNILEESEIEGARLNSNNLDELELGDADADMSSKKILEESKIEGAPLRSNNLDELESGNADANTRSKNILEESEIEGARLNSNNLDELELGDADADMSSKKILDELEIEGAPLRSNNLDELESGDVDVDTRSKNILEESEIEGARLNSNNLDELELGDADADMSSKKILDELEIEGAPLRSNNLDELELGDVDVDMRSKTLEESETEGACLRSSNLDELESGDVDLRSNSMDDLELGDVDANARSKISEASTVADEDAKGMNLDESKLGDELGLGFVSSEPVAVIHEARTSNDAVSGEMLCEGDEGASVGAAQKDGSQSTEIVLMTQEEVLAVSEEDEEAEGEEEKGTSVWSLGIGSVNDDDSMDAEENVSVEDLDGCDSDNEEGEESEQDGFEGCRGGVEMDWRIEDENGGEGTTHCLQRSDFPGMELENLNNEDVGMRDVVSFDDGFSEKLGSLHGMESTNLLQAMNSIPATFNGMENAHDLPSGEFLAMGAAAHSNEVDLGTGSSFFFGNNGKRHIGDINGYNDQMQAQQQFLQGNQQKRMRNCNNSVSSGSAFFNANILEPIQNLLLKGSIFYEQKEKELQEALSQKQYMANLLQEKDTAIQSLNSDRFEQENKYQAKLRCFEHDLNVMGQLVSGYKKALKQSHASFSEYRKKFPSNKFRYHDVPSSGGLVVSVNELERKRWEEEQRKIAAANEMIEDFQCEWFSKPDDWTEQITFLCSRIEELAREIDLLKEKRKAKVATLATEE